MKTILFADDQANLRTLVRTTLEGPEHEIIEACNGAEALEFARKRLPDLLVLNWMMPGLSGVEVAARLKDEADTAAIPIIMLTAEGQEVDRAQAQALGVYAQLVKPFSPVEILRRVQEVLG